MKNTKFLDACNKRLKTCSYINKQYNSLENTLKIFMHTSTKQKLYDEIHNIKMDPDANNTNTGDISFYSNFIIHIFTQKFRHQQEQFC